MSWQERDYADDDQKRLGRPGGDWRGIRPSFDNPATWALTIFRLGGITVRIHLFFIVFIVIMLLRSVSAPGKDLTLPEFSIVAAGMAVLFLIVLAHEFGHCLACRWTGGDADEILMWPLGGLAYCRPANQWRSHMATALGGPLVNVVLCALAGTMLGFLTGKWLGMAIPNPLDPFSGLTDVAINSFAHQALVLVNSTSFILLLFNLLPIFPLDGGRIVQVALWPRWGWSRSMIFAVRTGFIGAILLFIFGMVVGDFMVAAIALFGGFTCYLTHKQIQWTDAALMESDDYAMSLTQSDEDAGASEAGGGWREQRAKRMAKREQEEAREVDVILQKIATSGIESLTRRERALLKRVTERKRRQGEK